MRFPWGEAPGQQKARNYSPKAPAQLVEVGA